MGFCEFRPIADNATVDGPNANRRVTLVTLAAPQDPDAVPASAATVAVTAIPTGAADSPSFLRQGRTGLRPGAIANRTDGVGTTTTALRDAPGIAGNGPLEGCGANAYRAALAWLHTRIATAVPVDVAAVAA